MGSYGRGAEYWGGDQSDWDAWGRDQDFHEKVSYDDTWAKSYAAESYDEWDNRDADAWAKQAYGSEYDSRWGKSYDFVNANEYDDEQYARKVRADDDQWAEDWDVYTKK